MKREGLPFSFLFTRRFIRLPLLLFAVFFSRLDTFDFSSISWKR